MATQRPSRKVEGCTNGDQALDAAIAKARDKLVAWLSKKNNRANAEDVAHDAILRVLKQPGLYDARKGKIETWLFGVAKNLAIDATRHRKRTPLVDLDTITEDVASCTADPAELYEQKARNTRLYKALLRLPRRQRFPVILHIMSNRSYPYIATRLNMKPEQARYEVKKGLAALRTVLRE
jgi:RNA polymerase sigma-70 factor (ECF subfamily)